MYLFGAGGHAKVVIDILENTGVLLSGLFDDNTKLKYLHGYKVIGKYVGQALNEPIIISIGDNNIRAKIAGKLNAAFGSAIHSSAIISPFTTIDKGTVVMHGSIVQSSTFIGAHAIVNTGARVDHDCSIGDFAHISPGAVLCGHVRVGEGTHIGAGAVIIPGIKIGKWCKIGASAVVTQDVPDYSTVVSRVSGIK